MEVTRVVKLDTAAGYRYATDVRKWICDCHLNSAVHQRLAMCYDKEKLADHMAGLKSFKPTRVAERFLQFGDTHFWLRERMRQIFLSNGFVSHVFGVKQLDEVIHMVMDRNFKFELGRKFEQTAFWKENKPKVRAEYNKVKKVAAIMAI